MWNAGIFLKYISNIMQNMCDVLNPEIWNQCGMHELSRLPKSGIS
jgi:mannose-1-phosphate guanylyltransferase